MKTRTQSGFTLMEILVAMVLMAIVGANAMSSFSSSSKIVQSKNNTALNVARSYLEQLYEYVRQDTYGTANTPFSTVSPTLPSNNVQTLDGVTYTTTDSVTQDPNGIGADYRKVTMVVSW